jgi:hypothetical protein
MYQVTKFVAVKLAVKDCFYFVLFLSFDLDWRWRRMNSSLDVVLSKGF